MTVTYKSIITFKDNIPDDVLQSLRETAEQAFDNRMGKAPNISDNPRQCIFVGDDDMPCSMIDASYVLQFETDNFRDFVDTWEWIDIDEPDESHSVLEAYERHLIRRAR